MVSFLFRSFITAIIVVYAKKLFTLCNFLISFLKILFTAAGYSVLKKDVKALHRIVVNLLLSWSDVFTLVVKRQSTRSTLNRIYDLKQFKF